MFNQNTLFHFTQYQWVRYINLINNNHVLPKIMIDGINMIGLPLVIADSEQDMSLDWHTCALTTELQELTRFYFQITTRSIFTKF